MSLVSLTYCSRVSDAVQEQDIANILESSHKHNTDDQISGILCFSNESFLQHIEGPAVAVNALFQKISHDPRHTDVMIMGYEHILHRDFAHWDMAYVGEKHFSLAHDILFSFGLDDNFDPFDLSQEQAVGLLKALSKQLTLK